MLAFDRMLADLLEMYPRQNFMSLSAFFLFFFSTGQRGKNFPRQFPVENSRYWGLVKFFKKFSPRQFPVEKKKKTLKEKFQMEVHKS